MFLLQFLSSTSCLFGASAFATIPASKHVVMRSSSSHHHPWGSYHHQLLGSRLFSSSTGEGSSPTSSTSLPRIIETNGVPIHLYTDEIDDASLAQLKLLAESPIPTDYVSAMPDVHLGKGVTIGTVFASEK